MAKRKQRAGTNLLAIRLEQLRDRFDIERVAAAGRNGDCYRSREEEDRRSWYWL